MSQKSQLDGVIKSVGTDPSGKVVVEVEGAKVTFPSGSVPPNLTVGQTIRYEFDPTTKEGSYQGTVQASGGSGVRKKEG